MVVLGTRPEAIKLAPVVRAFEAEGTFGVRVVSTGQHRELVDQACGSLALQVDHDLGLMTARQPLPELVASAVSDLASVMRDLRPVCVVVQGDTSTTFAGALCAFYEGVPVAHVEAGLRSGSQHDPFPEEANRRMVTALSAWHFAPTEEARLNLAREGVDEATIQVTGNTGIDSLRWILENDRGTSAFQGDRKRVLVTLHRRENQEQVIPAASAHLRSLADLGHEVVVPLHPSPAVRDAVLPGLLDSGVRIVSPLDYPDFVQSLAAADVVITDSGGVQEEAPYVGTPVLVARHTTERTEAVEAGVARLLGDDLADLTQITVETIAAHTERATPSCPLFGDGHAATRIVSRLCESLLPQSASEGQAA
jgi:UDP-N-acetylglucosamine 2-epimerase (non-hydrolysing)